MRKFSFVSITVLLLAVGFSVSGRGKHPVVDGLRDQESRTTVVFIPGITGSKLRDATTGKTIWGSTSNLMGPHDGGRSLGLPIVDTPPPGERVEPFEIIEKMTLLGVVRRKIYGPLIDALVHNGYVRGNLLDPRPDDSLLVFPYDWRYGNVEAARVLGERLENLRRIRGDDVLHVVLICHSNAGRIARWYVKYGGGTLEDAEAGRARKPNDVVVEKIIFAATGQGGALPTLSTLDRGRRYVPLGRKIRPEYMFAIAGLFEALPIYRDDPFFDETGRTLPVDLFDPVNWPLYGWSVFGAAAQKRLRGLDVDDPVLGNPADRVRWLEERLDKAQRVHAALMRDVPDYPDVRLYQVQGDNEATAARALLTQGKDGTWRTLTIEDKRLRSDDRLSTQAIDRGDRHATRASQDFLSPQEQSAIAGATYAVESVHRKLFKDWFAREKILEFLAD